jgi:tRNA A37 threonylcarbamoyladenosine modification protein TsaB
VPELASRDHIERLLPMIDEALDEAGCPRKPLKALRIPQGQA